jgi:hypothetical protein
MLPETPVADLHDDVTAELAPPQVQLLGNG